MANRFGWGRAAGLITGAETAQSKESPVFAGGGVGQSLQAIGPGQWSGDRLPQNRRPEGGTAFEPKSPAGLAPEPSGGSAALPGKRGAGQAGLQVGAVERRRCVDRASARAVGRDIDDSKAQAKKAGLAQGQVAARDAAVGIGAGRA